MQYLNEFLTIAAVHFLAVVSPGPDFALITRNSLVYSRKSGIYSALGLGWGILVHVTYCIIGVGFLISRSPLLFNIIKYIGVGYLFYIAYLSLSDKYHKEGNHKQKIQKNDLTPKESIKMGFITNATNPKATLFFLSLFTVAISRTTPIVIKIVYGLEMSFVTFLWFAFVASIFSHSFIKKRITKVQFIIEKAMGIILILLAIKIIFSH
jgi:RhtB (resistance to homoserine/threonine) family protein